MNCSIGLLQEGFCSSCWNLGTTESSRIDGKKDDEIFGLKTPPNGPFNARLRGSSPARKCSQLLAKEGFFQVSVACLDQADFVCVACVGKFK